MQVSSSHIDDVDWEDGILTVTFKDGGKYNYADVPEGIFMEMISAPSVGQFFRANVKGMYEHTKVE